MAHPHRLQHGISRCLRRIYWRLSGDGHLVELVGWLVDQWRRGGRLPLAAALAALAAAVTTTSATAALASAAAATLALASAALRAGQLGGVHEWRVVRGQRVRDGRLGYRVRGCRTGAATAADAVCQRGRRDEPAASGRCCRRSVSPRGPDASSLPTSV